VLPRLGLEEKEDLEAASFEEEGSEVSSWRRAPKQTEFVTIPAAEKASADQKDIEQKAYVHGKADFAAAENNGIMHFSKSECCEERGMRIDRKHGVARSL